MLCKLYAVLSPPVGNVFNVKCCRLVYHFKAEWTRLIVFITSVSESNVGCWQVPLSVSPSGHSWTVYSTKLLFSGTASKIQAYDGKMAGKFVAGSPVRVSSSSGKICLCWKPESNLCRSSRDGLHSQLCTADEAPPVGGQGDAGGIHRLVALHGQQEGAGGAGLLELLRGVCVDQRNICTEVQRDHTGFKTIFLSLSFPDSVKNLAKVRLLDCSAGV